MLEIELNIIDCTVRHVQAMKDCASRNGYEYCYHGYDHLVICSSDDTLSNLSKMNLELHNICKAYGKDYLDILV